MAKRNSTPEPRSAQAKSFSSRQLKVRKGYYDYQLHSTSRFTPCKAPMPVPWVQIKGYWLHQAGFSVGTSIRVKVRHGCLVLKAIRGSSSL